MSSPSKALRCGRLELQTLTQGTRNVLMLSGELDADGCTGFEAALASAESDDGKSIVVDLTDVDFIDSSGIGALVAAVRRSQQDSGRLRFIPSQSEDVQRLLELCGLDGHLPLLDERADGESSRR